jgi:hypothetical protein
MLFGSVIIVYEIGRHVFVSRFDSFVEKLSY